MSTRFSQGPLRPLLPVFALLAALLWLFSGTASDMVRIWLRSDTFAHAMLVVPISAWLVWRQRRSLAVTPVRPVPWLLLPIAVACLMWLMGQLATVNAASQFALVTLIVLSVPAVLGWAVTRQILFPLGFLYFAVPFGEFLVPVLINWTADFTVYALRLSGVPVYREGPDFVIPSGSWSVVEACSGVRYLIASFMVGTLFAYLNYRSTRRRLMFAAVSLVVPIVANWLRAYMIVMIGHLSDNRLAVGVDHLIYGWVFFGVVIGLMFLIGARWSEPESPSVIGGQPGAAARAPATAMWLTAGVAVALMLASVALHARLDGARNDVALTLSLPPGASGADFPFQPGFRHPNAQVSGAYMQGDRPVWIWAGYYRDQHAQRKLVSSTNTIVGDGDAGWAEVSRSQRTVGSAGAGASVRIAELRQGRALGGVAPARLRVWQVYWVDGRYLASDAHVKILQAVNRLRGRGDDGAVLLLATPLDGEPDRALEAFLSARQAGLSAWLDTVRGTHRN